MSVAQGSTGSRLNAYLLVGVATLVAVLTLARVAVFWPSQAYLNTNSGALVTLAVDLSEGVFYRPLFGPDGYGGTRYFPLHVVLQAGLIQLFGNPVWTGLVMSGLSIGLLVSGVFAVLRRFGGSILVAASCATVVLASQVTQGALLSVRADALPVALGLWGLAFVSGPTASRGRLLMASGMFTLAFAAKLTGIAPAIAAIGWLARVGRRCDAAVVLAGTATGMLMVLGAMQVASGGVALHVILESGRQGAALLALILSPLSLARIAREVPETLVFIEIGAAVLLATNLGRTAFKDLAACYFAAAGVITSVIFSAQGADTNHLIELQVAAVLLLGLWIARRAQGARSVDLGVAVLLIGTLAASLSLMSGLVNHRAEQPRGRLDEVLAKVPDLERPILAENSLVPIAAGQRPYVADSYMFRVFKDQDPSFADPLWRAIKDKRFGAVVLERDPHSERGQDWYRLYFFGDGFIEELERHYEVIGQVRSRVIYGPRQTEPNGL